MIDTGRFDIGIGKADVAQFLSEAGLDRANLDAIEGKFMAAFVRATKPNTTPR